MVFLWVEYKAWLIIVPDPRDIFLWAKFKAWSLAWFIIIDPSTCMAHFVGGV